MSRLYFSLWGSRLEEGFEDKPKGLSEFFHAGCDINSSSLGMIELAFAVSYEIEFVSFSEQRSQKFGGGIVWSGVHNN